MQHPNRFREVASLGGVGGEEGMLSKVAGQEGFEPPAPGFGVRFNRFFQIFLN